MNIFGGKSENTISLIREFETIAKKSNLTCGGILGGTQYEIDLLINNKKTKFGFCKKEFDGLENLIGRLTELKEKSKINDTYNTNSD